MVKVVKYKSDPNKRAFKINWLSDLELVKFNLIKDKSELVSPSEELLDNLYNKARSFLKLQGFVFDDFTGCRVKYNKAKRLIEYGVEYRHIK